MKTKITLMVAIIIMAFAFNGCKKYDEGANFSFRSKQHRIEGEWDVTSYTINGESVLNYSVSNYFPCPSGSGTYYHHYENKITGFVWTFEKSDWNFHYNYSDMEESSGCVSSGPFYSEGTDTDAGTWKFNSDKTKITLTHNGTTDQETYTIKELREKEVKLQWVDGTDTYKITLQKR